MKKIFALFAAVLFAGSIMAADVLKASLDFTDSTNVWQLPTESKSVEAQTFTNGTYSITLEGTKDNGYRFYPKDGYLILGKQGATLTLPAFDWTTSKIVVTGRSGASAQTKQNIFVGDEAVSIETVGAKEANTYRIAAEKRAAGNVYVLKVTSAHNTQITKIDIYEGDAEDPVDTISVAEAIEAAMALDSAKTSENEYMVRGFVVNAEDFIWASNKQIFYLSDDSANTKGQKFQAYMCAAMEDSVAVPVLNGDEVYLKGHLFKYYNKTDSAYLPEIKDGVATFINKVDGDRSRPAADTISIARALAIGDSIGQGNTTTNEYVIEGYVTALTDNKGVPSLDGGWAQYGNQCMWVADSYDETAVTKDKAFFIYQGVAAEQVTKGAKIRLTSAIKNYNGMIENAVSKVAVTILEKGEDPIQPGDPDTITVAQAMEIGNALADNASTLVEYVVAGYAVNVKAANPGYTDQTWNMADEAGAFGEFKAFQCQPDTTVVENDFMLVRGKIMKYVSSYTTIEISKGTAVHGEAPAPVVLEPITVAEALEIAKALTPEKNTSEKTADKYAVKGYIVNVKDATKKTYYMADEAGAFGEFQAYRCATIDSDVNEGDLVIVTGYIEHYYGESEKGDFHNYEISGGTLVHAGEQGIENVSLTEKVQKIMLNGSLYIIRNGKMYDVRGAQVR